MRRGEEGGETGGGGGASRVERKKEGGELSTILFFALQGRSGSKYPFKKTLALNGLVGIAGLIFLW